MVSKEEFECGRSRVLHNFKLPSLKWGSRKVMRCMKVDDGEVPARGHRSFVGRKVSFNFSPAEKLGFGKKSEEVVFDFPATAEQRRSTAEECETMRPWNLRTRRARLEPEVMKVKGKESLVRNEGVRVDSPWCLRGGGEKRGREREREKFSVSLSKDEIEEDFMVITGCRVPRRPKKRAKNVQKQLDMLFPGLWLTEVNADLYKVPDLAETGKR
ncbi:hypothetical protein POM88_015135 [Heracleum sosnowskyi]|uniref:DUF1639 family protein n=1 Tax=Heracleum sosnowskyi TaxID=360622 RepID=A0AAD8MW16_9APIA|nr:hypothetical protein POM88_015135 [Heracleum sosnowskyi]